jgi:hypothetical protein
MSASKKIIDNPTSADILKQMQAFESLVSLCKAVPFAKKLLPGLDEVFSKFTEIKKREWVKTVVGANLFAPTTPKWLDSPQLI